MDSFTEALSVVPLVHLPVQGGQNVLLVGQGAAGAAEAVLRYPTTASVVAIDALVPVKDKRVQYAQRIDQLPPAWKADLIIVAVPVLTDSLVAALRAHHNADTGVVVFAIARPNQVRAARETLKRSWAIVQPYREHISTQPEPAWFLMAGDHGFQRYRPIPGWTVRLNDKYLPALFTFAKDEYVLAFGQN